MTDKNNDNEVYVSTMTLVEDKVTGEMEVIVQYSDMDYDLDETPVSYEIMSAISENYLQLAFGGSEEESVSIN